MFTLVPVRDTCVITAERRACRGNPVTQKIQSFPLKSVLPLIISAMMQPTDQMSTGINKREKKVMTATGRKGRNMKRVKSCAGKACGWRLIIQSKGIFFFRNLSCCFKIRRRVCEQHNPIMGANAPQSPSWGCLAHSVKSCLQNEKSLSPADTLIPGNGFQRGDSSGTESGRYRAAVKAVSAAHRCRKIRLSVESTHQATLNIMHPWQDNIYI